MRKYKFVDIETIVKHKIVHVLNLDLIEIHSRAVQAMTDKVMIEYIDNNLSMNEIDHVIDRVLYIDKVNTYSNSLPIFV